MKTLDFRRSKQLAVIASLIAVILCSWFAPLDTVANREIDDGFKRALVSFATARALNAVISVAQGTEIAIQPAGVGVIFTPGQLLDPINDLVEKFSNLMLAASVAFGVQKVLLSIGAHWLASALLTLVGLGSVALTLRHETVPPFLTRCFVVLLMIRFAIPAVTIGSDFLFERFMATDYQSSQQAISTSSGEMTRLDPSATAASDTQGSLDKLKSWWPQNADVKSQFEKLKQSAEQAAEHMIKLMVIFLLQTLVLPLFLLWGLYALARVAIRLPATRR